MLYEIVRMLSKKFYGGKNMKKILCLALAMMMCAMCFAGCGKTEADNLPLPRLPLIRSQ